MERTRIDHLDRQLLQTERRLERLRFEQEQLTGADLERELAELRETEQSIAEDLQRDQAQLAQIEAALSTTREARQHTDQQLQADPRTVANRTRAAGFVTYLAGGGAGSERRRVDQMVAGSGFDGCPTLG